MITRFSFCYASIIMSGYFQEMGPTESKGDQAEIERLEEHASSLRKVLPWEGLIIMIDTIMHDSGYYQEPVGTWYQVSRWMSDALPSNLFWMRCPYWCLWHIDIWLDNFFKSHDKNASKNRPVFGCKPEVSQTEPLFHFFVLVLVSQCLDCLVHSVVYIKSMFILHVSGIILVKAQKCICCLFAIICMPFEFTKVDVCL